MSEARTEPRIGELCRGRYGTPGRYIGWGRALCVAASDSDLMLQDHRPPDKGGVYAERRSDGTVRKTYPYAPEDRVYPTEEEVWACYAAGGIKP